jgi:alkylation response protein AidB-like acyl-CoA dehydrogenase
LYEMLNSANQAWTMYPGLTHGAYSALSAHGSDEQKQMYLPKLTSGEWTGTMCLTEPHCGTDLGMLRTKAEPLPDGAYRITGQKIFISSGEHDLAGNIIHLVLARLPDAPVGTKGISLFAVPKFMVNADGSLGERNPIFCSGLEEKMGIHGNATCQMTLDGAVGTLVGQPNRGLNAMFVMMNGARIGVGMQSLGLTEVAYQNALAYAKDRVQMRSLTGTKAPALPADPIIVHPDVRKMLLTAKAYAEGGRALALYAAQLLDREHYHPDAAVRAEASEFMRDARINMIYEGTNTIQSLDLLGRKVLANQGETLKKFGERVAALIAEEKDNAEMAEFIQPLAWLGQKVQEHTMSLGMRAMRDADVVGSAAVDYLRVVGHLVLGYFWARMAKAAQAQIAAGNSDAFYVAKVQTARFYFAKLLPETASLMRTMQAEASVLMDTDAALA